MRRYQNRSTYGSILEGGGENENMRRSNVLPTVLFGVPALAGQSLPIIVWPENFSPAQNLVHFCRLKAGLRTFHRSLHALNMYLL